MGSRGGILKGVLSVKDVPSYVITTPIRPDRDWTLPMYKEGIEKLDPQPEAVGIVTSPEMFEKWFAEDPLYVFVAEHPPMEKRFRIRVSWSREQLRSWFEHDREEEYMWWIDSDIEVFKTTFTDIVEEIEKEKSLGAANGYQGRNRKGGHNWHATGCLVLHRAIIGLVRHYEPRMLTPEGELRNICDDYLVLTLLRNMHPFSYQMIQPDIENLVIDIDVTPVIHYFTEDLDQVDLKGKESHHGHDDSIP